APALKAPASTAPAPTGSVASMQVTGKPVARVNGAVLTDHDLLREMMTIFPYARTHNGFPKEMEPSIRNGALKMIEFEELAYQESVRRSLLIEAFLQSELEVPSRVTLAEARQYYAKNPGPFTHQETIQFQTISVMPPENASADVKEQARKQADELWQKAKATHNYEEFGLLAEKHSQDDFRVDMGNHKATARTALPAEALKILDPMKPGAVSGICQFGPYYTIFRLQARTPAGKAPFEQVRTQLQDDMHKERYNTLRATLDKKLRAQAKVEEL